MYYVIIKKSCATIANKDYQIYLNRRPEAGYAHEGEPKKQRRGYVFTTISTAISQSGQSIATEKSLQLHPIQLDSRQF